VIRAQTVWLLLGMAAVTFLPRFIPLALWRRRPVPEKIARLLHFMPVSIMAAIVFPALLSWAGGKPSVDPLLLASAVPVFIFAVKTKNLWGAVLIGMACYWALGLII
jgi:branched-subunit amino acid transport protein